METDEALACFAALSQGTRLETVRLLVRHGPEGLPAGEIARRLAVPQNTLSTHLALLTRAGLLRATRRSRSICYRVDLARLRGLLLFLVHDCCDGRAELCQPLIAGLMPPDLASADPMPCRPPEKAAP